MIQMKFNILGAGSRLKVLQEQTKCRQFYLHYLLLVHCLMHLTVENLEQIVYWKTLTKNTIFLKIIAITAVAQIFVTEVFSGFFNSVPLSLTMWLKIILLSSLIIVVNEVVKLIIRPFVKKGKGTELELEEDEKKVA